MSGELQGGWAFVWAAYGIVWFGLVAYGASLVRRRRAPVNGSLPADGGFSTDPAPAADRGPQPPSRSVP